MSTAAVMLVKDEVDVIDYTIRHLIEEVHAVYVADNASTDGTSELLLELRDEFSDARIVLMRDEEVGYFQSRKTTDLAMRALEEGHRWVVPCDADEWWYATDGRRICDFLDGQVPDTYVVQAQMFNHFPTPLDDESLLDPFARIGWRHRERQALGKVCCRLRDDLVVEPGNHSARYDRTRTRFNSGGGLVVRHYSWRSPEQYVTKIRNGEAAYAATTIPPDIGTHWRMWEGHSDDDIIEHFHRHFVYRNPASDESLIFDPIVRA